MLPMFHPRLGPSMVHLSLHITLKLQKTMELPRS
jgi:hypothetical protein